MFELNALEMVISLLWILGVASAVFLFLQNRSIQAALLFLAAVVIPVVGSLSAIVLVAMAMRGQGPFSSGGSTDTSQGGAKNLIGL